MSDKDSGAGGDVIVTPPPSKKRRAELAWTPPRVKTQAPEPDLPAYNHYLLRRLWHAPEDAARYSSDDDEDSDTTLQLGDGVRD